MTNCENEFFGKFEGMGTMKKINKIFSEKLNNDFSKNKEISDLVVITFNLRDKLAHFKSKKVNLLAMQDNPELFNPYELIMEHYEKMDEVVTSILSLKS